MYQGRTAAEADVVIETGLEVTLLKKGDRIVLPLNVADGRCRNCEEGRTAFCTGVNPGFAGGAYGYVAMGWAGVVFACPVCGLQCAEATGGKRSTRHILRYWRIFSQRVGMGWC